MSDSSFFGTIPLHPDHPMCPGVPLLATHAQHPAWPRPPMSADFAAGAAAGFAVDLALFPIDTIKTRVQAAEGFAAAGGFRQVYRGLSAVAIQSVPSGGLFFATYTRLKAAFEGSTPLPPVVVHGAAASVAEAAACAFRVPMDQAKQLMQAGHINSLGEYLRHGSRASGLGRFYKGYGVTLSREIPFAVCQFTLYERLRGTTGGSAAECAGCGFVAGGVAGALTTPIDVAKTRIMLDQGAGGGWLATLCDIARREGIGALWKGVVPRTAFISVGGAVFLGTFEFAKARIVDG